MPDLPINVVLPSTEAEVNSRIKWLNFLQGGGLSIFIAVIGLAASIILFQVIMSDRNEDRKQIKEEAALYRNEDKEFRKEFLADVVNHTKVTAEQTEIQRDTNKTLEETKNALVDMGDDFKELADQIKVLSTNEKHTAESLNRVLEKAWGQATAQPQPTPQPPQQ